MYMYVQIVCWFIEKYGLKATLMKKRVVCLVLQVGFLVEPFYGINLCFFL